MTDILSEIEALRAKVKDKTAAASEKLALRGLMLDLEKQKLDAKYQKLTVRKRAEETKMKVILGAWVLHNAKQPDMRRFLAQSLPGFLSDRDKAFLADFLDSVKGD